MAKSKANKANRGPTNPPQPPPVHHPRPTIPSFDDPVIVSGNRYADMEPYCTSTYQSDHKRWRDVMPWEFPQYATREEEEAFLDECFGEREVHLQGGRGDPLNDGAGYRFLKQAWYSMANFNLLHRCPAIGHWWWHSPENDALVYDVHMLPHMYSENTQPESFFGPEDFDIFGEKLLFWAMRYIRCLARERMEELTGAQPDSSTSEHTSEPGDGPGTELTSLTGEPTPAKTSEVAAVEPAPDAVMEDAPAETVSESADVAEESSLPTTAPAISKDQEDAEAAKPVQEEESIPATTESAVVSDGKSEPLTAQPPEPQSNENEGVSADVPTSTIEQVEPFQPVTADVPASTIEQVEPLHPVTADVPASTTEQVEPIRPVTAPTIEQVEPHQQVTADVPASTIEQAEPHQQVTAEVPASTIEQTQHLQPVTENQPPAITPPHADNQDFISHPPLIEQPASTENFDSSQYNNHIPGQQVQGRFYHQEQNAYDMPWSGQFGYPEYIARGGRGGRRGSRGDNGRRLSRGGGRGRHGPLPFDEPHPVVEQYQMPYPQPYGNQPYSYGNQPYPYGNQPYGNQPYGIQPYGNQPYVPPMMQGGQGGFQHTMVGEPFYQQHPGTGAMPYPEPAYPTYPQHFQHGHQPYVPPMMPLPQPQPQSKSLGADTPMIHSPSSAGSADPRANEVSKNYIGSNRSEVNQLVIFGCPLDCSQQKLEQLFANIGLAGTVVDVRPPNITLGYQQHSLMAFARLQNHDQARHGLVLNGTKVGGHVLTVEVSKEFWDPTCSRYQTRYRVAPPALPAHMHAVQQHMAPGPDGSLTPLTNPYEGSNDGREIQVDRHVSESNNGHTRHFSNTEQAKTRILPTQDARYMDPADKAVADATPSVKSDDKEISPHKQKRNKNKKAQTVSLGDDTMTKAVSDKTNQATARPSQSGDTNASRGTQKIGRPTTVAVKQEVAPSTSPIPSTGAEQSLRVGKRAAPDKQPAQKSAQPKAQNKPTLHVETNNTESKVKEPSLNTRAGPTQDTRSASAPTAAPAVETTDFAKPAAETLIKPATVEFTSTDQIDTEKLQRATSASTKVSAPNVTATTQNVRVVTPKRAPGTKPSPFDDIAQVAAHVAPKKQDEVTTVDRKASETFMPPTPASTYTTAPPTPTAATTDTKVVEEAVEKAPEKVKGPSHTESLSMFGKKQTKAKKKSQKGKETLKEKPKELAKMMDRKDTNAQPAAETTTDPHDLDPATLAKPKGKQKGKQKAAKANAAATATADDVLKQESVAPPSESPVTSPGKRKIGTFSSLIGSLLGRQSSNTVAAPESSGPDSKSASEAKQSEDASPIDLNDDAEPQQQGSVSHGLKRLSNKSTVDGALIDKAEPEGSKQPLTLQASSGDDTPILRPVKGDLSEVVGLGLSDISALDQHHVDAKDIEPISKGKQRAVVSSSDSDTRNTPPSTGRGIETFSFDDGSRATFERDKGDDAQSQSSCTLSASSTPSSKSPAKLLSRQDNHLIEAPRPRNAGKRKAHRPQSSVGLDDINIVKSKTMIASNAPANPAPVSGGEEKSSNQITVYTLPDTSPLVYNAERHKNRLYLFVPPTQAPYPHPEQSARPSTSTTLRAQSPTPSEVPLPQSSSQLSEATTSEQGSPPLDQHPDIEIIIKSTQPTSDQEWDGTDRAQELMDTDDNDNNDLEQLGPLTD